MRRLAVWIAIVGVGLLLPATAGAQGGAISGLVEDTTGGILPGVTIEADSPVNIEGTLTAFTDGAGRYTIINLRPGTYTVTFTLPGFNTFVREDIILSGDANVQINAQMAVGALEETVTVSGESPVVDVQQVRRQFVATRAMMDVLPTQRTFAARALLIPGVRNTGMGEGQYWPAVHGSTWRDAQTMNDGMRANVIIDDGQWQMGWFMNDAATSELTYEAGGAPAEAQVGGVIQNAIPKEGGNTLSGTWFTYYNHQNLNAENASAEQREALGELNKIAYDYDTNPAIGGKFIQDKLWWFGSMRRTDTKTLRAGSFFGTSRQFGTGDGDNGTQAQRDKNGFGAPGEQAFTRVFRWTGLLRLTNQVTDRHKWRIGFEKVNETHPLQNVTSLTPPENANRIPIPTGYHTQARWTSSLSNRLLVEAGFSVQYSKWRREQFEWNAGQKSAYNNLADGTWGGSFWITGAQPEKSRYFKTSASYVTGSHNFKGGFEHRWGNVGLDPGPMAADIRTYFHFNGFPIGAMVLGTPLGDFDSGFNGGINYDTALFAQDSWTLGNWTLNLGVRGDFFSAGVKEQFAPAGAWVPERDYPAFPGPSWNTVVGRFGVAYDVFGDGRTAIKALANQYLASQSTTQAMFRNPLASFTWSAQQEFRSWADLDGNGSALNQDGTVQFAEIGPSPNENWGTANSIANLANDRDGHWEYQLNIQHEVYPGISLTGGWYRRNYYKEWYEDNIATTHGDYSPFSMVGPSDPRLGMFSGQTLPLFNLDPALFGASDRLVVTSLINDRIYDGLEFVIDGRLPNGAFFGGSFTHERTNVNTCDTDNPNQTLWCDSPRTWQTLYKAHGAYPLPGDVILSGFVQGYPGPDLDANFSVSNANSPVPLTGGQTINIDLLPHETMFLPFQRKVDLRVMRRFNAGNLQVAPVFDIYNLINTNTVTSVIETYGSRWQEITNIMNGRRVRLGLELEW